LALKHKATGLILVHNHPSGNLTPSTADQELTRALVKAGQAISTSTPEIWRWFIGAALLILMLEWYIYNRRVMI